MNLITCYERLALYDTARKFTEQSLEKPSFHEPASLAGFSETPSETLPALLRDIRLKNTPNFTT